MGLLLLFLLTFSTLSFASVSKVSLQNLNFDYVAPYGAGTVQKVSLGFSLYEKSYPVEVFRTEDSFELTSDFFDMSWKGPWEFVYNTEKLSTKKTSLSLGLKEHFIKSDSLIIVPFQRGEYRALNLDAKCKGEASGRLYERVMDDCRREMQVSIKRLEVPTVFILHKILSDLPQGDRELEIMANDLSLQSNNGDFSLIFSVSNFIYANLRVRGHFMYENNYKTIAIRVDQIRSGSLPVTSIVMRSLQQMINSPHVKIDPPWIRVNLGNL